MAASLLGMPSGASDAERAASVTWATGPSARPRMPDTIESKLATWPGLAVVVTDRPRSVGAASRTARRRPPSATASLYWNEAATRVVAASRTSQTASRKVRSERTRRAASRPRLALAPRAASDIARRPYHGPSRRRLRVCEARSGARIRACGTGCDQVAPLRSPTPDKFALQRRLWRLMPPKRVKGRPRDQNASG